MKRFEFLRSNYEELYKLCSEAEEQRNMNKARQAIELIVRQFGATKRHLFDRIGEVSESAEMSKEIIDAFHQVRLVGNKASHDETLAWNKITKSDVEKCLNALFEIAVWLALAHDKKIYKSDIFRKEDLEIVSKYQIVGDKVKSKHETIKKLGIDVNPLAIEEEELNFENEVEDELTQDVFETMKEYTERIYKMPLRHIGYGILDTRERDKYTGLVFLMFHIERDEKIQFSEINAFIAQTEIMEEDFIDGKIIVGLKVSEGKVYCDYERVYLQGQNGNEIKLTAICWNKHGYEDNALFNERLMRLPMLPLGEGKPIRREYDLSTQCLPFRIALYKYMQSHFTIEKVFATVDRELAKEFCTYNKHFGLYGKISEIIKIDNWSATLRHDNYKNEISCDNYNRTIEAERQYMLGEYYRRNGHTNKAMNCYERAAKFGHSKAQEIVTKLKVQQGEGINDV